MSPGAEKLYYNDVAYLRNVHAEPVVDWSVLYFAFRGMNYELCFK